MWAWADGSIVVPVVSVTLSLLSISSEAIMNHHSMDRVVPLQLIGYIHQRESVDLNEITESLTLLWR